ncbi:MAG: hypothetical protein WCC17_03365 [Candidatus Nitrosopolaris sp.]
MNRTIIGLKEFQEQEPHSAWMFSLLDPSNFTLLYVNVVPLNQFVWMFGRFEPAAGKIKPLRTHPTASTQSAVA